jgi:hypothetical protein
MWLVQQFSYTFLPISQLVLDMEALMEIEMGLQFLWLADPIGMHLQIKR